jgi:PKD repeat protein
MFAVDGEPDDGGGRGMERGTYTWNSTSGAFTATAISGTAGDWGISYLTDPTASIDGNTLTIIDSNDGPIPLTKVEGFAPVEYIQLSGTITETGQVSGTTSHTFLGTGGEGTFTGQLSGNTLSIVNPGQDTYGDICNYTRTMSATRAGITPVANFSATSRNGNAPLSVNFTDESMGTITSWYWNFGDDANSTNQNPSHLYAVPGIYTVSLTVSGPAGSETETKIDYIFILSEPISSEWVAENNMLTARDSFTGGVIDGKIYVFGGNGNPKGINLKSTEMFDPETHLWIYKSSNENNNGQGVEELTGAVFNDKLYVFGAWGGGTPYGVFNFVQKYDPATDTWTSKAPKPTPVSSAIATIYNGEIFVFGGEYANDLGVDVTYDVVEAYNPISDSWRTVTNMPYTLGMMSIGIVGTKAYLIGGLDFDTYNIQQNVIAYDFESNHWITNGLGTLPTPRLFSYSSSAPIVDGKIYQIGGMVSNVGWTITGQSDVSITNDVLIYNPSTQSFSSGPPLPQATNSLLALSINNSIYAIGGETDWENDIRTNAVWRLDLAPKPNITPIISLLLDDEPEGNSALLEGEWNINGLASGDGAPWFERGNMFVGSDGTFTGSVTVNDGISKNISGKFNLSNDRILSLVGNSNFGGSLDLLNRVMVWTDTWTTGSPGTTELKVSTRQ